MRLQFVLSVVFVYICLAGCNKNNDVNPVTAGDITGTWELRYRVNGLLKSGLAVPGNGTIYEFRNNHYKNYQDHILYDSGTYSYEENPDSISSMPLGRIVLYSSGESKINYWLNRDTLCLIPLIFTTDGYSLQYVKIAD